MKNKKKKKGRREFLKGSIQALIVAPATVVSLQGLDPKGETFHETEEPLPGDPGYRDPEADYDSIAEYE